MIVPADNIDRMIVCITGRIIDSLILAEKALFALPVGNADIDRALCADRFLDLLPRSARIVVCFGQQPAVRTVCQRDSGQPAPAAE